MTGRLAGRRLVIATHNAGKLREFEELLAPFSVEIVGAGELNLAAPEEGGDSFEANARLKARAAADAAGLPALGDDSGLAVDALDGAPGVESARWAGPDQDYARAMRDLEEALEREGASTPADRRARFVAVLCLAWPEGGDDVFSGAVAGTLAWPPRGEHGFGYDPMFRPDGHDRTFGEMSGAEKHALSHRARAFAALREACLER